MKKSVFCTTTILAVSPFVSTFTSCSKGIYKMVSMADLYNGYTRKTNVHEFYMLTESSDGLPFYFDKIADNNWILVDDLFSAMAKVPVDLTKPCEGKMGIRVKNVDTNKCSLTNDLYFDNVAINCKMYDYILGEEIWIDLKIDGQIIAKNIPFDIAHENKAFGPWQEHEWWLGLDIRTLFDNPDPDLKWQLSLNGTVEYKMFIVEEFSEKLSINYTYSYQSSRIELVELRYIIDGIGIFFGGAYIPLEYMHNVASQNDPPYP